VKLGHKNQYSPDTQSLKLQIPYRCQSVSITAEDDFVLATSTFSQVPVPVVQVPVPVLGMQVQVQVPVLNNCTLSTDQVPVPVPSTSTLYNKTVTYCHWMLARCVSGTCLLQVVEKFLQLKDPTTFVLSPMMIKTASYLYAVSTTLAFVPTACQNSITQ